MTKTELKQFSELGAHWLFIQTNRAVASVIATGKTAKMVINPSGSNDYKNYKRATKQLFAGQWIQADVTIDDDTVDELLGKEENAKALLESLGLICMEYFLINRRTKIDITPEMVKTGVFA